MVRSPRIAAACAFSSSWIIDIGSEPSSSLAAPERATAALRGPADADPKGPGVPFGPSVRLFGKPGALNTAINLDCR